MKKNWKIIFYSLSILVLILYLYLPITKTFYQQDEWMGYGFYLAQGPGIIFQNANSFWEVLFGKGRILTTLLQFIFHRYSPLNVVPASIFAIFLHTINTILVFYLGNKILKNSFASFIGSLFFAVSCVSQSAVTWMASSINTLPSTTLILFALIFYFKYLEKYTTKWLIVSFFLIYISFFFKETGVFLFAMLPVTSLLFKKYSFTNYVKTYWYYFLALILIVAFRLIQFKLTPNPDALFLTGSTSNYWLVLFFRLIFYPLTSFSLVFVPPEASLLFARIFALAYYQFPPVPSTVLIAQTAILDMFAVCLTFLISGFLIYLLRYSNKEEGRKIIFICLFLLFNYLPFAVISKSYAYLESRYYYVPSIAAAIIISWVYLKINLVFKTKYIKILTIFLYILFLYSHAFYLTKGIAADIKTATERKSFITQLRNIVPVLGDVNVFYIDSDSDYYIVGNKVPFQEGMGFTLMAIYYNSGKIPKEFLANSYLFDLGSNGFYKSGNLGFGYFTDKKKLLESIKENKLNNNSIYYLYYDSKSMKLSLTGK